jgi:hypothetical protein
VKRKATGERTKVAGGADAPAATGVAPAGKAEATRGAAARRTGRETPAVTVAIAEAAAGSEPALRSGKDAFLIKDKDSY